MTAISDEQYISTIYDRLLIEDDTEESVSGSDYHLAAIFALYDVLLRYAQRAMKRWYVTAEVLVLVDVPDRARNPWRAMPDVYVVLDTPDTFRISLDTRTGESFPQFLCEVASDSTWDRDIVEKQRVYADLGAGVPRLRSHNRVPGPILARVAALSGRRVGAVGAGRAGFLDEYGARRVALARGGHAAAGLRPAGRVAADRAGA